MTTSDGTTVEPPAVVRRVESPAATALADLCAAFEDLQTVLRCCELLVASLAVGAVGAVGAGGAGGAAGRGSDPVTTEAVWTTALLSYARCFPSGEDEGVGEGDGHHAAALTEDDVAATQAGAEALEWHRVFLRLRGHYAHPSVNPRERFSVGVAQDSDGAAAGVAITSIRQPLVDDVTVRQMGAVAYALSTVVDARIGTGQERLFEDLKGVPPAELDQLATLDVALSDAAQE
jgi:hypothetical protein